MKNKNKPDRPGRQLLAIALLGLALVPPLARADRWGVRSSYRSVHVSRGASVSVHRDVDVNVFHSGGYYHGNDHGHFWGGFATGLFIGAVISAPPPNPQTVVVQSTTYLVSEGVYYQPSGTGYVVVNPPPGVIVSSCPPGAVQTVVNGQLYFVANGMYYRPAMQNGVTVYTTVLP
jgi:hypothetical protein